MRREMARRWTEALRSGKYKQAQCQLNNGNGGFCCLGVLCDIVGVTWEKVPQFPGLAVRWLDESVGEVLTETILLPGSVMAEAGMATPNGQLKVSSLTQLNDRGLTFGEIANVIDAEWERL